jgi:hypothetical protein
MVELEQALLVILQVENDCKNFEKVKKLIWKSFLILFVKRILNLNLKMFDRKNLSVFIPRVLSSISSEEIRRFFEYYDFGRVRRVCLSPYNASLNKATVYFDFWNQNKMIETFHEKILSSEDGARIMYDEPNYWNIYLNRRVTDFGTNEKGAMILNAIGSCRTNAKGMMILSAIYGNYGRKIRHYDVLEEGQIVE